ncbi:MAG: sugar phosphate isomerase/epimerase [Oscillospiraceae bacterium]|nr:sugar phosphate isomerase/epimerase [Oscillospiraceae bacterium]MBQ3803732.1 sugar phosphate isomerase/epimerase [Oscillospiraceae bacterium]
MKKAVQQIMLGTVTGNEAQTRETLQRIKAAGYDGLELNRFMIHPSSLMVRLMTRAAGMPTGNGGKLDWNALVNESGLAVVSLHTDLGSLEREPEAIIGEAESFGTDKVVITGMYRYDYSDEAAVRGLANRLNRAGEMLRESGLSLLYHNHNVELLPVKPGLRAYEILIEDTDRSNVSFEFDSYWFTDGGADAKVWMRKLGSRMKLWHVTDRGSRQKGPAMTPILKADSMELGTGSMDLDGLKEIAVSNGIEAVVLESHKNWIGKDPVRSLEVSAKWLNERF